MSNPTQKIVKETDERREKAFELLTICQFIMARTPMILGYAVHNNLMDRTIQLASQFGTTADTIKIVESEQWVEIKKILGI